MRKSKTLLSQFSTLLFSLNLNYSQTTGAADTGDSYLRRGGSFFSEDWLTYHRNDGSIASKYSLGVICRNLAGIYRNK
jgi:hypothetical protein